MERDPGGQPLPSAPPYSTGVVYVQGAADGVHYTGGNAGMPAPQPPTRERAPVRRAYAGGYDSDVEGSYEVNEGNIGMQKFADKAIRRGFIRKVYSILLVQLILTGAIVAVFCLVQPIRVWVRLNVWISYVFTGVVLVCMIIMGCFPNVRRKTPMNYIFLSIFTVAEGCFLGVIACLSSYESVLIAVGACAAVSLGLTLFAFQTKFDFTTCGGMLCALMIILVVFGLVLLFVPYSKYAIIAYGAIGALLFSGFLVYDTQLMLGGSHRYSIDPEEYVFAALNLYLDIIFLFMYILTIVNASK